MRVIIVTIIMIFMPALSFSKDYKDIYMGNEVQWELTASELIHNFEENINVIWFGKVVGTRIYPNQEGGTSIEWLCCQYPFISPSIDALSDPIKVKKDPEGYFVINLILPTVAPGEARDKITSQMEDPTYALVSGSGVYVNNIGFTDAIFLKTDKLVLGDEFEVEFQEN